jgi:hypothetical protein
MVVVEECDVNTSVDVRINHALASSFEIVEGLNAS